jgi:hypothetical protein
MTKAQAPEIRVESTTIPAISVWQPWASAIATGVQRIETRPRDTHKTGWIAIHASKRWTEDQVIATDFLASQYEEIFEAFTFMEGQPMPLGAIIAVADLADSVRVDMLSTISPMERDLGNYASGRYGWVFREVRPLTTPLKWKGSQGWFHVPLDQINPRLEKPL